MKKKRLLKEIETAKKLNTEILLMKEELIGLMGENISAVSKIDMNSNFIENKLNVLKNYVINNSFKKYDQVYYIFNLILTVQTNSQRIIKEQLNIFKKKEIEIIDGLKYLPSNCVNPYMEHINLLIKKLDESKKSK